MNDSSFTTEQNNSAASNKTSFQEAVEFFRDAIIIFLVVILLRTYVVSPFRISGNSMEENYHDDEYILVDKFSYLNEKIAHV